jgi:hypothetical protein
MNVNKVSIAYVQEGLLVSNKVFENTLELEELAKMVHTAIIDNNHRFKTSMVMNISNELFLIKNYTELEKVIISLRDVRNTLSLQDGAAFLVNRYQGAISQLVTIRNYIEDIKDQNI